MNRPLSYMNPAAGDTAASHDDYAGGDIHLPVAGMVTRGSLVCGCASTMTAQS